MAQHDYIIANQSGAGFRSDLNNGLAAIVSQNSGAAEPSTTYAYQWWADTTTGLLKIRNAANNAWITIGTLASANLGLLSLAGGTLTGALLADDSGTAALPAIAFDGDTNTGIFRAGADQLGIATNGVERVEFGTTEVVFNDGGADVDFRVEGDTKANLFKVDAGTDTVIIDGLTHPSADGTADQSLVTNGSGVLGFASRSRLVSSSVVSTTPVTSIDFTSIPSWAIRITVNFFQVSTNGTSDMLIQLGSGSYETTGYLTIATALSGVSLNTATYTTGFAVAGSTTAAARYGSFVLTRILANGWIGSGNSYEASSSAQSSTSGGIQFTSAIERVRITTVNGTDTFDGGVASITYEG
jgi:hypothetical protein